MNIAVTTLQRRVYGLGLECSRSALDSTRCHQRHGDCLRAGRVTIAMKEGRKDLPYT